MKIYLYLIDKIISFSLPQQIVGSFSFDENLDEETKLINIEARDNKWVIYSTTDVKIINNNNIIDSTELLPDNFYILTKDGKKYLIYISNLTNNNLITYKFAQNINLIIGNNNNCNINYPCPFLNNLTLIIYPITKVAV